MMEVAATAMNDTVERKCHRAIQIVFLQYNYL